MHACFLSGPPRCPIQRVAHREQVQLYSPALSRCDEGEVIVPWGTSLHSLGYNQVSFSASFLTAGWPKAVTAEAVGLHWGA